MARIGRPMKLWALLGLTISLTLVPLAAAATASDTSKATQSGQGSLRTQLVLLAGRVVSAGASTSGYVVLDNTASTPIAVAQGCEGKPDIAVYLSSRKVPQAAYFPTLKCPDINVSPGIHRYPVVITGSYQGCTESVAGRDFPSCLPPPDRRPPPLPVGRYQAVMATDSSIPTAKPLSMTVIPPRTNKAAFASPPLATTLTVPTLRSLQADAANEVRANGDRSVHRGYLILTTRQQAATPDVVNSDQPVYEVVIQGRFTCGYCSIPPGAKTPTGTVLTSSVDRENLHGLDFDVTRSLPSVLVGEPVYQFRF